LWLTPYRASLSTRAVTHEQVCTPPPIHHPHWSDCYSYMITPLVDNRRSIYIISFRNCDSKDLNYIGIYIHLVCATIVFLTLLFLYSVINFFVYFLVILYYFPILTQTDGRTDGWTEERTDGRMDREKTIHPFLISKQ
jgi:hypothetical protein